MSKMTDNKLQPIEVTINNLSHDGRGIAHYQGKIVFVNEALPGETVSIEIYKKHSQFDEARLVDIIQASSERVVPQCEHFGICGGCSLQHFSPQGQIEAKQEVLLHNFRQLGQVSTEVIFPPLTASVWHYRRKARIGVKYVTKKDKVVIGFREKKGHFIADLTHCEVLDKAIGEHLTAIGKCFSQLSIKKSIPQIEIAVDDQGAILVIRHLEALSITDKALLIDLAKQYHFRLYLQPKGLDSIQPFYPQEQALPIYSLNKLDLSYQFHPCGFIQVNRQINEKMIDHALALLALEADDKVIDLFCGLGNFTLPIAQKVKMAIGVEGEQSLIDLAKTNAQLNQLENVQFYKMDLFKPPFDLPIEEQYFDKILLDPPRSGAKEILPQIHHWQPKRIVYVSCDTATLARDAGILVNQYGYKLAGAGVMDMFPHTTHVESIALFTRD